jgi:two-component system OmpR family sensor kinase
MSRIESEAGRMGVLVEDLLMLARLDRQRPPALRRVDLLEIAADTIRDAHARMPDRPVKLAGLSDDTDTFEPATVLGDEHGLRQVATNLVANALQHTPDSAGITVRVGTEEDNAVLEVCDEGPGMSIQDAHRVFERFYRADSSRTRASGGAGLGLSIVDSLVYAHGGTVSVTTAPGEGCRFKVNLPRIADVAAAQVS